ncbi:hypothetical protein BKA61DRAFT_591327 [Leptodontidium sp. MPI-SDFR-AT-0119]|nr:hypothetical protein BKA61DRAFT_591327 [Leptodontidium sp. MPI-SDFR-AT-0119]
MRMLLVGERFILMNLGVYWHALFGGCGLVYGSGCLCEWWDADGDVKVSTDGALLLTRLQAYKQSTSFQKLLRRTKPRACNFQV